MQLVDGIKTLFRTLNAEAVDPIDPKTEVPNHFQPPKLDLDRHVDVDFWSARSPKELALMKIEEREVDFAQESAANNKRRTWEARTLELSERYGTQFITAKNGNKVLSVVGTALQAGKGFLADFGVKLWHRSSPLGEEAFNKKSEDWADMLGKAASGISGFTQLTMAYNQMESQRTGTYVQYAHSQAEGASQEKGQLSQAKRELFEMRKQIQDADARAAERASQA